jgi:hypothetical protein
VLLQIVLAVAGWNYVVSRIRARKVRAPAALPEGAVPVR